MASIFTNEIVATAIGSIFQSTVLLTSIWIAGGLCSMILEADVFGSGSHRHWSSVPPFGCKDPRFPVKYQCTKMRPNSLLLRRPGQVRFVKSSSAVFWGHYGLRRDFTNHTCRLGHSLSLAPGPVG